MADSVTLTVLSGELQGRRFVVDLSGDEATVGSDPACTVQIQDPAVAPRHAMFQRAGGEILVQAADAAAEIEINGQPIPWLTPVNDGDRISLGPLQVEFRLGGEVEAAGAEASGSEEPAAVEQPFSWPPPGEGGDAAEAPEPLGFAPEPEAEPEPAFDFGGESHEAPAVLDLGEPAPGAEPPDTAPEPPAAAAEPPPAASEPAPLKLKAPEPPVSRESESAAPPPRSRPRPAPQRAPTRAAQPLAGRAARRRRIPVVPILGGVLALAALAGAGWYFGAPLFLPPTLDSVAPPQVAVGELVVLEGSLFSTSPEANTVLFGDTPGRVTQASRSQLQVEVPELPMGGAPKLDVGVYVRVGDRSSDPLTLSVLQPPRVTGFDPEAGQAGELIRISGAGFEQSAVVRFGDKPAEVVAARPDEIRVRVPAMPEGITTVTVTLGGLTSTGADFIVGQLPMITSLEPESVAPGGLLTVRGKGLGTDPGAVFAQIGGVPALVVSATGDDLQLAVPRIVLGEEPPVLELRVSGSANTVSRPVAVSPLPDPVGFHFFVEPFTLGGGSGVDRAVLSTVLGPAFVISASGGQSAAQRAVAAQARLNGAASRLAQAGQSVVARGLEGDPSVGLAAEGESLLDVTAEDAAAYEEAWARPRGVMRPVDRARLARWWGALAGDLARLLARGEPPQDTVALAQEGRVLAQIQERSGGRITQQFIDSQPALRESVKSLGLKVPSSVPAAAAPVTTRTTGGDGEEPEALTLEGRWRGTLRESGRSRPFNVTFQGAEGVLAYEGAVSFSQPISNARLREGKLSFTTEQGGGTRYFEGTWDGEKMGGTISTRASGQGDIGTFELRPPRR